MRRQSQALSVAACLLLLLLVVGLGSQGRGQGQGQGVQAATPEALGFSRERLGRLDAVMQRAIDDGHVPGIVTLIARRGQIAHLKAYGSADPERGVPMRTDAIFRIGSTTKLVTSVALMQLLEEGRLLVTDPVSKYLPTFKKTSVAVLAAANAAPGTAPYTLVPAKREITLHDVLTKMVGSAYPAGPTAKLYEDAGFTGWDFTDKTEPMCVLMEKLGTLPFQAHPGERWMNGYTADILGCVIEKVSGLTLDEFMRTRIFQPLKMSDTYFYVPKEKASRFVPLYVTENGKLKRADGVHILGQMRYLDGPGVAFSGGGGLVSTASDYARFLQMLLNGGELDGVRVVSPKTVELMTSNHVGSLYQNGEMGFGFNVDVNLHADRLGSVGDYGWSGWPFERFRVDPTEQMVTIFYAQLSPPQGVAADLPAKFLNLAYQALVDSTKRQTSTSRTSNGQ